MGDGWIRRSHCMTMADSSLFEESTWGFHLQQAIEKALKAIMEIAAENLVKLGRLAGERCERTAID